MNPFEMTPKPEIPADTDSEKVPNLLQALETAKSDAEAELAALGEDKIEERNKLESEIADIDAQIEKSKKFFPEQSDPDDIELKKLYPLHSEDVEQNESEEGDIAA